MEKNFPQEISDLHVKMFKLVSGESILQAKNYFTDSFLVYISNVFILFCRDGSRNLFYRPLF